MFKDGKLIIAKNEKKEFHIIPKMANRHGLIAGGTGSGKTTTLKTMAESFSSAGVPIFLADVKGDIASVSEKFPTQFFEIERKYGLPVRTTISNFGPTLLSHILSLNATQSDILNVIFKIADDEGLLLLDMKDLKKMIDYVGDHAKDFADAYGNIAKASLNTIQRSIVSLEQEGIEKMFGEPELDLSDILKTDSNGKGVISILHSQSLILSPRVYSAFMLWLLSEIYEAMPEVGDLDKPKLIFCFDEAHLLFKDCSSVLIKKLDQMTKLIRSKGIGLYFITQDPCDIPDTILQQLGNRVQHVHRSYTAKDKKNHKAICDSFRENKDIKMEETLENLGTGEALISFLDDKGAPNVVDIGKVILPESRLGTIDDVTRDKLIKALSIYVKYINDIDRESAYEKLNAIADAAIKKKAELTQEQEEEKEIKKANEVELDEKKRTAKTTARTVKSQKSTLEKQLNSSIKSVMRSTGSTVGREVARSLTTSIFGKNSSAASRIAGNVGSALGRNILGTLLRG